jgi:hypothetical protein
MHKLARMLPVGLAAVSCLVLLPVPGPTKSAGPGTSRTVYLASAKLPDKALVSLGAAVAARPGDLLLIDSPGASPGLRRFLSAYHPDRVVPVGEFVEGHTGLARRLGVAVERTVPWPTASRVCPLWQDGPACPDRLIVCPPKPRGQLLRAAWLAACERVPLWLGDEGKDRARLGRFVRDNGIREVVRPPDLDAAIARRLSSRKDVSTAVIANPGDTSPETGGMSAFAPWLAASKGALLLLTNARGDNVQRIVEAAAREHPHLDTLLLAANLKAIPVWQRPNPIPGDKDPTIDLEPLTPTGTDPFSYAIGRLFHEDRAAVPLMLAWQRLAAERPAPRRALVASNPGGGLGLLEAFSRNTHLELANAGYQVTGLYGKALNAEVLRREMPRHDVVLWEGHHNTLVKDWGFLTWDEPLPASLVFLQSCLALQPEKVQPLLSRGAVAVVGTSTRTYSGSGGAFSLAYFNALLYDGQSLGGSLRSAKNFLVAYAALKEKRLGKQASRTGANFRAAWAFSLWGDPTFQPPRPPAPSEALQRVRHAVEGNQIVLSLPGDLHNRVKSDRYRVRMPPNGRLAGLIRKTGDENDAPVVPMVFAEVALPKARPGATPRLRSRLPARQWVFLWDGRRQTGYLLATPKVGEERQLRFAVEWTGQRMAGVGSAE